MDCPRFDRLREAMFPGRKRLWDLTKAMGDSVQAKQISKFILSTRLLGQFTAVEEDSDREPDTLEIGGQQPHTD